MVAPNREAYLPRDESGKYGRLSYNMVDTRRRAAAANKNRPVEPKGRLLTIAPSTILEEK